jgi:hypothetical protein
MPFLTKGKTNWKYILILVVLAIIVGGGILVYLRYFEREISSLTKFPEIKKPEKIEPEKPRIEEEIANWKTYRNEKYKFEFKYPKEYDECEPCKLEETDNLITLDEGRFAIEIIDAKGITLEEYANKLIKEYYGEDYDIERFKKESENGTLNTSIGEIIIDNNKGIRINMGGSRYALFILLLKNNKIYQISTGPVGVTNCFGYAHLEGKCLEIDEYKVPIF